MTEFVIEVTRSAMRNARRDQGSWCEATSTQGRAVKIWDRHCRPAFDRAHLRNPSVERVLTLEIESTKHDIFAELFTDQTRDQGPEFFAGSRQDEALRFG
jgi:hypothetical protein